MIKKFYLFFLISGCVIDKNVSMDGFEFLPIKSEKYEIATWQKIQDKNSDVHIYIEGDGYAFNASGRPSNNPTPRGTLMRDLANKDTNKNVIYIARPCQFIMGDNCNYTDWTTGRFSQDIINSMSLVVKKVAGNKPVVLIGYSGGAMISGLVIQENPNIKVKKWITIAGMLNHSEWTEFFGDIPLKDSKNLYELPNVVQVHYVGDKDKVVPIELSKRWLKDKNIVVVNGAGHADFENLDIDF